VSDVLSIAEVALRLGIGRNGAYAAVQRGEIPFRRVGRRIIVPRVAFERWLADTQPRRRPAA
jgi:excisionase family DNA binding protein